MITFKQYLAESERYTPIPGDTSEILEFIKKHCSDAMWMLEENDPLWRGGRELDTAAVVDPTVSERKSVDIPNHYTVLLDNNPYMKDYPKRSRSLIASTSGSEADRYGYEVFAVIPFNNVPIGVVNASDIWNVDVKIFGEKLTFKNFSLQLNNIFAEYNPTFDLYKQFDTLLKNGDESAILDFKNAFPSATDEDVSHFLEKLMDAMSPKNTGFKKATTKDRAVLYLYNTEVWIGGKCVVIPVDIWNNVLYLAREST